MYLIETERYYGQHQEILVDICEPLLHCRNKSDVKYNEYRKLCPSDGLELPLSMNILTIVKHGRPV